MEIKSRDDSDEAASPVTGSKTRRGKAHDVYAEELKPHSEAKEAKVASPREKATPKGKKGSKNVKDENHGSEESSCADRTRKKASPESKSGKRKQASMQDVDASEAVDTVQTKAKVSQSPVVRRGRSGAKSIEEGSAEPKKLGKKHKRK